MKSTIFYTVCQCIYVNSIYLSTSICKNFEHLFQKKKSLVVQIYHEIQLRSFITKKIDFVYLSIIYDRLNKF